MWCCDNVICYECVELGCDDAREGAGKNKQTKNAVKAQDGVPCPISGCCGRWLPGKMPVEFRAAHERAAVLAGNGDAWREPWPDMQDLERRTFH